LKSEPNLLTFDPACPFCPGNEYLTGTPTYSYRQGNSSTFFPPFSFIGRVIRNKYPVVHHALEEDKSVKPTPLGIELVYCVVALIYLSIST
jgi:galactose-1-phosphate uridylyltransferase